MGGTVAPISVIRFFQTGIYNPAAISGSAIADPERTQKGDPGFGWDVLSVRLRLVSTVSSYLN